VAGKQPPGPCPARGGDRAVGRGSAEWRGVRRNTEGRRARGRVWPRPRGRALRGAPVWGGGAGALAGMKRGGGGGAVCPGIQPTARKARKVASEPDRRAGSSRKPACRREGVRGTPRALSSHSLDLRSPASARAAASSARATYCTPHTSVAQASCTRCARVRKPLRVNSNSSAPWTSTPLSKGADR
jgi:hypothetical protein